VAAAIARIADLAGVLERERRTSAIGFPARSHRVQHDLVAYHVIAEAVIAQEHAKLAFPGRDIYHSLRMFARPSRLKGSVSRSSIARSKLVYTCGNRLRTRRTSRSSPGRTITRLRRGTRLLCPLSLQLVEKLSGGATAARTIGLHACPKASS